MGILQIWSSDTDWHDEFAKTSHRHGSFGDAPVSVLGSDRLDGLESFLQEMKH